MIGRYLLVSTVHVTPDTYDSIETMMENDGFPAFPKEGYGYFIWVFPKELMDPVPKDLEIILDYVRECDCDLLILDSDAEWVEDLPTYSSEWDSLEE